MRSPLLVICTTLALSLLDGSARAASTAQGYGALILEGLGVSARLSNATVGTTLSSTSNAPSQLDSSIPLSTDSPLSQSTSVYDGPAQSPTQTLTPVSSTAITTSRAALDSTLRANGSSHVSSIGSSSSNIASSQTESAQHTPVSAITDSNMVTGTRTSNSANATTTMYTPLGSAIVGNATFANSCARSNMACWSTCTAYAWECMTSWEEWYKNGQSCTDAISTYLSSWTTTNEYIYSSFVQSLETVVVLTEMQTYPGLATVESELVPASSCTLTDSTITAAVTTDGNTYTAETPYCSSVTANVTVTFTGVTDSVVWTATYASQGASVYATSYITSTITESSTSCQYRITPPSCTFSNGPYEGECKLGPDCNACTIYGGTVQLLYFPVSTAAITFPNATTTAVNATQTSPTPTASASTAIFDGTTLVSPSVYISFETVYAVNDCNSTVGQAHTGSIMALNPTDLSSALGNWHARVTDTSLLAEGKTDVSLYAEPFTLADLNWPYPPWVWDQQARCNDYIAPVCPIIVSGQYNPVLAVPTQVRNMDPAWATCAVDLEGLYDPPHALQPVAVEASATAPSAVSPTSTPAAAVSVPASPVASTTNTPSPTSTTLPTAGSDQSSAAASQQSDQYTSSGQDSSASQAAQSDQSTGLGRDASTSSDLIVTPGSSSDPSSVESDGGGSGTSVADPISAATVDAGTKTPTASLKVTVQSVSESTTLNIADPGSASLLAVSVGSFSKVVTVEASTVEPGTPTDPSSAEAITTVGLATIVRASSTQGVVVNDGQTLDPGQTTAVDGIAGAVTISANGNGGVATASQGSTVVLDPSSRSSTHSDVVIVGHTLTAGGSADVIDGTTYSALPSTSGIVAVSDGHTTTLTEGGDVPMAIVPDAVLTSLAGFEPSTVTAVDGQTFAHVSNGIVVDGSATLIAGSPTTIDGILVSVDSDGGLIIESSTSFGGQPNTDLGQLVTAIESAASAAEMKSTTALSSRHSGDIAPTVAVTGSAPDPTSSSKTSGGSLLRVNMSSAIVAMLMVAVSIVSVT